MKLVSQIINSLLASDYKPSQLMVRKDPYSNNVSRPNIRNTTK